MKKGNSREKGKPPSRDRYDKKCPVVSIRLPEEVHGKLQEVMKATGMSKLEILKLGLGLAKVKVRSEEEVRRDAHDKGMLEGFKVAEDDFKVTYRCSKCGEPIDVESTEEREAAGQLMTRAGWGHIKCPKRRRQR